MNGYIPIYIPMNGASVHLTAYIICICLRVDFGRDMFL